jgi:hypothetical protein
MITQNQLFRARVLQNDACEPTINFDLAMNFHGAAKVQALVFLHSAHDHIR